VRARVNLQIIASEVRVVADDGTDLGVLSRPEALALARSRGEDLIEVHPEEMPPLCLSIDYGKYQYQLQEARKGRAHD
jgi:translation initiation factor IF-3